MIAGQKKRGNSPPGFDGGIALKKKSWKSPKIDL